MGVHKLEPESSLHTFRYKKRNIIFLKKSLVLYIYYFLKTETRFLPVFLQREIWSVCDPM